MKIKNGKVVNIEMNDLVTIVVPVYKVEKYLDECVETIVNQTYKNLEIILVDDGSPDKCPEMCDEWVRKDGRIKVIHQQNAGVSAARNAGLSIAQGKYICFIDSDDIVELNYIEELYQKMGEEQYDIVFCKFGELIFETGIVKHYPLCGILTGDMRYDFFVLKHFLRNPFNKMYQMKIIKQNDLKFPCGIKLGEDWMFNLSYFVYANKVGFVDKELYIYNHHLGSATDKKFLRVTGRFVNELERIKKVKQLIDQLNPWHKEIVYHDTVIGTALSFTCIGGYRETKYRMQELRACMYDSCTMDIWYKSLFCWLIKHKMYPIIFCGLWLRENFLRK